MIVKILNSASKNFVAVNYLENKNGQGKGELMLLKNFPEQINYASQQQEVKDYFKSISNNGNVNKPQFHAVISTERKKHDKIDLLEIANNFMDGMGYKKQPYLIVFHDDTDNNHVHIVSTRVNKENFKKINDSFEKYKAQTSLQQAIKKNLNIDHRNKIENLLTYSYSNINQLNQLLKQNRYENYKKDNDIIITHNGVKILSIKNEEIKFNENDYNERKKQLKAILYKLKNLEQNKVFKVEDKNSEKIAFHSQLQSTLKNQFGIDIIFSNKDDKTPFGYTLIDNKNKIIFKGSEIEKINNIFDFTSDKIDKRFFEILTNCNKCDGNKQNALKMHLEKKFNVTIKDYMILTNKPKIPYNILIEMKELAINKIKNINDTNENKISFIKHNKEYYAYSEQHHKIIELNKLVNEKTFKEFTQNNIDTLNPNQNKSDNFKSNKESTIAFLEEISNLSFLLSKTTETAGTANNENSEEKNRKRKRKR